MSVIGRRYVPVSALPPGFSGRDFYQHGRAHGRDRDALEGPCRRYAVDGAHWAAWCATADAADHLEMAKKSDEPRARETHVAAGLRSVERMVGYLDASRAMEGRHAVDCDYDPLNLNSRCRAIARALQALVTPVVIATCRVPRFRLEVRS